MAIKVKLKDPEILRLKSTTGGTVKEVNSGDGLTGGPITLSGTLSVLANTGLIANSSGLFVNTAYISTVDSNTVGGNTAQDLLTYSDTKAGEAYSNGVLYTDTKAGEAYSNGVLYTETYADTKAGEAYSNSVAYTETYTDTKAGEAYSNAVSYTDTKSGEAYSNAVSYTDTKAGEAYSNAVSYTDTKAGEAYANSQTYADNLITNLINQAPTTLDTLNELALALDNDPNFATTIITTINDKAGEVYSNAVSYTDTKAGEAYSNAVSFSSNASNISTGTLSTSLLEDSGVVADTYGNSSTIPVLTVDEKGRVTNISTADVAGVENFTYESTNNTITLTAGDGSLFNVSLDTVNNFIVTGNLTVSGHQTYIQSNTVLFDDNMLRLNAGLSTPTPDTKPDIGFVGFYSDDKGIEWNGDTITWGEQFVSWNISNAYTGIFRDASDGIWKVFESYAPNPDNDYDIDINDSTFKIADFQIDRLYVGSISANGNIGTPGQVLHSNGTGVYWGPDDNDFTYAAGSDTQIQFNNSGSLSGSSGFTFNNTTNTVFVANSIGIGTSSPASKLDVVGLITGVGITSSNVITVQDTSTRYGEIDHGGSISYFTSRYDSADGGFIFRSYNGTAYTNRFKIETNGDLLGYDTSNNIKLVWDASSEALGIGTTTPDAKLFVTGSSNPGYVAKFVNTGDSTNALGLLIQAGTNNGFGDNKLVSFAYGGTEAGFISNGLGVLTYAGTAGLNFKTNSLDRLSITSSGDVGIGTTSPSAKLDVTGSKNPGYVAKFVNTGDSTNALGLLIQAGTNNGFGDNKLVSFSYGGNEAGFISNSVGVLTYAGTAGLNFKTNSLDRLSITSAGKVGIGTSEPDATLTVNGTGRFGTGSVNSNIGIYDNSNNKTVSIDSNGNSYFIGGNVGIGTTSPDSGLTVNNINSIGSVHFYEGNLTGHRIKVSGRDIKHFYNNDTYPRIHIGEYALNGEVRGISFNVYDNTTIPVSGSGVGISDIRCLGLYTSDGTSLVERIRIDSSGNVGIGTTSPSYRLHVIDRTSGSASGDIARFENNPVSGGYSTITLRHNVSGGNDLTSFWGADGIKGWIGTSSDYPMAIFANNSEKMRITSSGNVGIGTNSPNSNLHINSSGDVAVRLTGGTWSSKSEILFGDESSGTQGRVRYDNSIDTMLLYSNSSERVRIDSFGNVGIGTTEPDTYGKLAVAGNIMPAGDASYDLGSPTYRWNNVYTTDLHLSNENKPGGNDVDGTTGNWTLQEGADAIYMINNITGKKYKIALEEVK